MAAKTSVVEKEIGVIDLHGNLMGGAETVAFQQAVMELLNQNYRKVVLDFSDVPFMNSTGLGVIISAHTSAVRRGGRLTLCNMNSSLGSLLVITGLSKILDVKKTREEAVAALV